MGNVWSFFQSPETREQVEYQAAVKAQQAAFAKRLAAKRIESGTGRVYFVDDNGQEEPSFAVYRQRNQVQRPVLARPPLQNLLAAHDPITQAAARNDTAAEAETASLDALRARAAASFRRK